MKSDEKDNSRRRFLKKGLGTAGLLSAGGAIGWWIQKNLGRKDLPAPIKSGTKAVQAYDLEPFVKFDPKYEISREISGFSSGMEEVSRLALAPDGDIWIIGGQKAKAFALDGTLKRTIELSGAATSLAFSASGEVFFALTDHVVGIGLAGETTSQTPKLGERSIITGLAVSDESIFVADAGQRRIFICDLDGAVIHQWGKKDAEHPGFVIPSPYFPLRRDAKGQVVVANTGRLRLETYMADGTYQTSWGEPGMGVDAFCGCCNPVFFDLMKNGDVVTSEKGLVRIHRYRQDGTFVGVVAGPEQLWTGVGPETKLSGQGKMGDPFDIAVDDLGRVFALDPHRHTVRVFVPKDGKVEG